MTYWHLPLMHSQGRLPTSINLGRQKVELDAENNNQPLCLVAPKTKQTVNIFLVHLEVSRIQYGR